MKRERIRHVYCVNCEINNHVQIRKKIYQKQRVVYMIARGKRSGR